MTGKSGKYKYRQVLTTVFFYSSCSSLCCIFSSLISTIDLYYVQLYVLIIFHLKAKPQPPYYPMISENNLNKYYPGTCQHEIQPSIYPQQVLESCHSVKLSTIHLFQLKLIQICGAKLAVTIFLLYTFSCREITSSINKHFRKCSPQSFSCQV